jgi:opacity protein-like surface antigen
MLTPLAERPFESLIGRADSLPSLWLAESSREAKSQVQVLRSALISRRAVGRGRFSVTCQAVEIGRQGSVSFKFSQAFTNWSRIASAFAREGARPRDQETRRPRDRTGAQDERPFDHRCFGRHANARNRGGRAGLPVYKAAPPPLLATNWSGFYFGGHAGAAWGSTNDDFNDPTALAPFRWDSGIPVNGPLAGGQIGYNWQSGWMLFGLEADGSWSNITGHGLCNTTTFFMNCSSKIEGLATVTGRVGASIDRALIYFKGGGAWGRESETISNVALAPLATAFSSNLSANR